MPPTFLFNGEKFVDINLANSTIGWPRKSVQVLELPKCHILQIG